MHLAHFCLVRLEMIAISTQHAARIRLLLHRIGGDVRLVLEGDWELAHVLGAHHDFRELVQAPEHVVLDVRHPMLVADLFHQGLSALVR